MPRTKLIIFQDRDGSVPLLDWFEGLDQRVRAKCRVRLGRLAELGHELRRPEADYLRDDVYELRVKHQGLNLRMLYFFHGKVAVVVSHGFSKQQAKVPPQEITVAIRRMAAFQESPEQHTFTEEI